MTGRVVYAVMLTFMFSSAAAGKQALDGRELAHNYEKGNCLACHKIPRDKSAVTLATIGPALENMRERYPDREVLRKHIWDPTVRNPYTVMPPFGKHKVLSEDEIDAVIDYLYLN
jgi:sulfur-oxidizing protein SoxX